MDFLLFALIFFAGASIGSFLSVLVARLGRQEGIMAGRSECPGCRNRLAWYDLIPVVSYIALRRRCRSCGTEIPWLYLAMELALGISAVIFLWRYGLSLAPEHLFYGAMVIGLWALFFFDYSYFILPDRITGSLAVIALLYRIVAVPETLVESLITAFVLSGIFAILYVVSHGSWIGFGDVKLVALFGLIFNPASAVAVVVLSIWIAAGIGLLLLLIRKATSQTALPFGSFLALTAIVFILFDYEPSIFTSLFL